MCRRSTFRFRPPLVVAQENTPIPNTYVTVCVSLSKLSSNIHKLHPPTPYFLVEMLEGWHLGEALQYWYFSQQLAMQNSDFLGQIFTFRVAHIDR
jgi:hypothetical protein